MMTAWAGSKRGWRRSAAMVGAMGSLWLGVAVLQAADAPAAAPAAAPVIPKLQPYTPAALGSVVKDGARVAIVGDSITEQKQYSRFIDAYLTACQPQLHVQCFQFGWGGERAPGFQGRMANDMLPFKPTVVTLCYGMNDGGYGPYNEGTGKAFDTAMREIIKRSVAAGATVVVGTSGPVDTTTFRKSPEQAKVYNETLGVLGALGQQAAAEAKQPFADLHTLMCEAMAKAKAAYGNDFPVCGGDGVHPGPGGHLLMAYAFLKNMGLDGDLGTITVDMKGAATAVNGHKVLSAKAGTVELESTRFPFAFSGAPEKDANGTRSMLPFTRFNEDLNRLTLAVGNLDTPRAAVTWGKETKEFSKEDLAKGINLAAEFNDSPLANAFRNVENAIGAKQNLETVMIKASITAMPGTLANLDNAPDAVAAVEALRKAWWTKHDKLQAAVTAAMAPVKHTLVVAPVAAK